MAFVKELKIQCNICFCIVTNCLLYLYVKLHLLSIKKLLWESVKMKRNEFSNGNNRKHINDMLFSVASSAHRLHCVVQMVSVVCCIIRYNMNCFEKRCIATQYLELIMCIRATLQFIYYKLFMNRQQRLINLATMMVVQLQSRKPAQRIQKIKMICIEMNIVHRNHIAVPTVLLIQIILICIEKNYLVEVQS